MMCQHQICVSVMQCVAAYCSVLQCVAVCCSSVLHRVAVRCIILTHDVSAADLWQCVAV